MIFLRRIKKWCYLRIYFRFWLIKRNFFSKKQNEELEDFSIEDLN